MLRGPGNVWLWDVAAPSLLAGCLSDAELDFLLLCKRCAAVIFVRGLT